MLVGRHPPQPAVCWCCVPLSGPCALAIETHGARSERPPAGSRPAAIVEDKPFLDAAALSPERTVVVERPRCKTKIESTSRRRLGGSAGNRGRGRPRFRRGHRSPVHSPCLGDDRSSEGYRARRRGATRSRLAWSLQDVDAADPDDLYRAPTSAGSSGDSSGVGKSRHYHGGHDANRVLSKGFTWRHSWRSVCIRSW